MSTHWIEGRWVEGSGEAMVAFAPASGEAYWRGRAAGAGEVNAAIDAARRAGPRWSAAGLNERIALLEAYQQALESRRDELAGVIAQETGKPRWEASAEVDAMIGKAPIAIEAHRDRLDERVFEQQGVRAASRFRAHGVLAVFGPFNLPGHLPNGHIVPALLAGNAVVLKPSEQTPLIAERMAACWEEAGLPAGVLNLVQGAAGTGQALAEHAGHDGILFTGSYRTGMAFRRALVERPEKILALEMGGNNPLVVDAVGDVEAAAVMCIQSAYVTAGQRCTCARRLIVPQGSQGDRFIEALQARMGRIRIGGPDDEPAPFMGPLIDARAAGRLVNVWDELKAAGGRPVVELRYCEDLGPAFLSPGLIDVSGVKERADEEHFGPLLQLIRPRDFEAAIAEANDTAFGLVAGLLSDDAALYERFYHAARAGLINWNRPTTGASSRLPFGGIKRSGNHRPAGYLSADYCAHAVASLESEKVVASSVPPGLEG